MTIILHINHAFRRTYSVPVRLLFSVLIGTVSLYYGLLSFDTLNYFERKVQEGTRIGKVKVVRIAAKLSQDRSAKPVQGHTLSDATEFIINQSEVVAVEYARRVKIISSDRTRVDEATLILYRANVATPRRALGFPTCSINHAPEKWRQEEFIFFVHGWRCRVVPAPVEMKSVMENAHELSILLHENAKSEIVGVKFFGVSSL